MALLVEGVYSSNDIALASGCGRRFRTSERQWSYTLFSIRPYL